MRARSNIFEKQSEDEAERNGQNPLHCIPKVKLKKKMKPINIYFEIDFVQGKTAGNKATLHV